MITTAAFPALVGGYADQVRSRLDALADMAAAGGLDSAVDLLTRAVEAGAVIQAFGTGHSEAFAMEIAGRAGGLIPTNKIALHDLVLRGSRPLDAVHGSSLERDSTVVEELWNLSPIGPGDVFVIASNSGVNGSVVGLAILAKQKGHGVVAVTSLQHTRQVTPKHPSGRRLCDVADVVVDNLAPYGDATLTLSGVSGAYAPRGVEGGSSPLADTGEGSSPADMGAISSITSAFIAQLLTIGVAERISADGREPPLYLSANIPGGDAHNAELERLYEGRIRRGV
jgi:uncharacterized phosphosugar-binding protein